MFAERRRKEKQDREVCSGHAWEGRLARTDRDIEGSLASTCTAAPFFGVLRGERPSLHPSLVIGRMNYSGNKSSKILINSGTIHYFVF